MNDKEQRYHIGFLLLAVILSIGGSLHVSLQDYGLGLMFLLFAIGAFSNATAIESDGINRKVWSRIYRVLD